MPRASLRKMWCFSLIDIGAHFERGESTFTG